MIKINFFLKLAISAIFFSLFVSSSSFAETQVFLKDKSGKLQSKITYEQSSIKQTIILNFICVKGYLIDGTVCEELPSNVESIKNLNSSQVRVVNNVDPDTLFGLRNSINKVSSRLNGFIKTVTGQVPKDDITTNIVQNKIETKEVAEMESTEIIPNTNTNAPLPPVEQSIVQNLTRTIYQVIERAVPGPQGVAGPQGIEGPKGDSGSGSILPSTVVYSSGAQYGGFSTPLPTDPSFNSLSVTSATITTLSTTNLTCNITWNIFCDGGNTRGANLTIGTNDNFSQIFETNNIERLRIETDGTFETASNTPLSFGSNNTESLNTSIFGKYNNGTGASSSLFGFLNNASGTNSSAFGILNQALAGQSTAIGYSSFAYSTDSLAIGRQNNATGTRSSAIGNYNNASGTNSSAFGYLNTASAANSSAFGYFNIASGTQSSAFGYNNQTPAANSSAFGILNQAFAAQSTAIGYSSFAYSTDSLAIGRQNNATGTQSSAIGNYNNASNTDASAFGRSNNAVGSASSAFGYGNRADGGTTSAFGYSNEAYGVGAVSFGYNNLASNTFALAIGANNITSGDQNFQLAIGRSNTSGGFTSTAMGQGNLASSTSAAAIGNLNISSSTYASAIGTENIAYADRSSALGQANKAIGIRTTAVGYQNWVEGSSASGVGYNNVASGTQSSAFGQNNKATGANSSAFGYVNTASGTNSSAFGYNNINGYANTLMIGMNMNSTSGYWNTNTLAANSVAFGVVNGGVTVIANGNVGIGTTTPSAKLAVAGDVIITGVTTLATTSVTQLTFTNASGSNSTSTNLFAQNASLTNATSSNFFANIFKTLTAYITDLFFGNATGSSLTAGTLIATNTAAINNLTGGTATFTNITATGTASSTNLFSTNATLTNIVGTNASITNATISNIFVTGSTRFSSVSLADIPAGGPLTTALILGSNTVFNLSQTTANQTITIPNPTNTATGTIIYLNSVGSVGFTLLGQRVEANQTRQLMWNGNAWKVVGDDTGEDMVQIRKSGQQNLPLNSTVLTQVTELSFPVAANETWIVQVNYDYTTNASANPDIRVAASSTNGAITSCNYNTVNNSGGANLALSTSVCNTALGVTTTATGQKGGQLVGTFTTGGTAGSFVFGAAQNTADAANTVRIATGSSLLAYRVRGADLAEVYYSNDFTINEGDIVSLDGSGVSQVVKSNKQYDKNAIGIISTKPGKVLGENDGTGKPVIVGLSGRVPVKVSLENGPIKAGDYITTSKISGVGIKATKPGRVIGKALMDLNEGLVDENGIGKVMVFIENTFWNGLDAENVDAYLEMQNIVNRASTSITLLSSTSTTILSDGSTSDNLTHIVRKAIENLSEFFFNIVLWVKEIRTNKIFTDEICVKKVDGTYNCINGDNLNSIILNNNATTTENNAVENITENNVVENTNNNNTNISTNNNASAAGIISTSTDGLVDWTLPTSTDIIIENINTTSTTTQNDSTEQNGANNIENTTTETITNNTDTEITTIE